MIDFIATHWISVAVVWVGVGIVIAGVWGAAMHLNNDPYEYDERMAQRDADIALSEADKEVRIRARVGRSA